MLLIQVLATWRLTNLLYREDGPLDVFARLRDRAGVRYDEHSNRVATNPVGKALCCFWCTSVWTALAINLFEGQISPIKILACSAGAILIEQIREGGEHGT